MNNSLPFPQSKIPKFRFFAILPNTQVQMGAVENHYRVYRRRCRSGVGARAVGRLGITTLVDALTREFNNSYPRPFTLPPTSFIDGNPPKKYKQKS